MKILMATSEAVPFAKTGGLADAVSALALALAELGHDVRIVLPRYYSIDKRALRALPGPLGVPVGFGEEWAEVFELPLSDQSQLPYYLIEHEGFFGRDGIYGTASEPDFADNPRRFGFFCHAIFQLCRKLDWYPDIIHAHDWPTALVPVLLKYGMRSNGFSKTVSILTIHNLGYQGIYAKDFFPYMRLPEPVFKTAGFEDWDRMNLLKAGLVCADKLTTVSPSYAEETKTTTYGFRLDAVLRSRQADYRGILNGVDTRLWNPKTDTYLPEPYDSKNLKGKSRAKKALQAEYGLAVQPDLPLLAMVSRLTEQKGVGELFGPGYGSAWAICSQMRLQFVVLGSGEIWCENELRSLSERLPNFKAKIGYSERLSHLIEAGSDFFLMPSRYEPCGLNQMYSQIYGSLPIVRRTGGLADTVENYNPDDGGGTGFVFDDLTPQSIYDTVGWALWVYNNRPEHIKAMRQRAMAKDFSWRLSAERYIEVYQAGLALLA